MTTDHDHGPSSDCLPGFCRANTSGRVEPAVPVERDPFEHVHLDADGRRWWGHRQIPDEAVMVRRDAVQEGDILHSSHGYNLPVVDVRISGDAGQTTELIVERVHLDADAPHRFDRERYDSDTYVPVTRPGGPTVDQVAAAGLTPGRAWAWQEVAVSALVQLGDVEQSLAQALSHSVEALSREPVEEWAPEVIAAEQPCQACRDHDPRDRRDHGHLPRRFLDGSGSPDRP